MEITKGQSPFYPGQPVPLELFTGRQNEILRIERALNQVALGKPQSIFLTGEYGIGKSSLAGVMRHVAEKNYNLFAMQVMLGEATTIDELSEKTIESVLNSEFYEHSWTEKIRTFLAKYIGEQSIFGITLKLDELKKDAPNLSRGFLPFFRKILKEFSGNKVKGIFLVFDELNGITKNPQFAYFIKNLIDENALSRQPVPILIMLCSVPERRKEMIKHHQPIDRIFEIIKIEPFNDDETKKFFLRVFNKVNYSITEDALEWLCKYSDGLPKAIHIIGNNIFWLDKDTIIDLDDAVKGILISSREIGELFVDDQVYDALKSKDYKNILKKLVNQTSDLSFNKSVIEKNLTESEKRKLNNFLQKMKKLHVFRSGDERGEYIFINRMVKLYISMNTLENN